MKNFLVLILFLTLIPILSLASMEDKLFYYDFMPPEASTSRLTPSAASPTAQPPYPFTFFIEEKDNTPTTEADIIQLLRERASTSKSLKHLERFEANLELADEQKESIIRGLERFRDHPEDTYEYALNECNSCIRMKKKPSRTYFINILTQDINGGSAVHEKYNYVLATLWKKTFINLWGFTERERDNHALDMLRSCAAQHFIPAMSLIGLVYDEGLFGEVRDRTTSIRFYGLAGFEGRDPAALQLLSEKMFPFSSWLPKKFLPCFYEDSDIDYRRELSEFSIGFTSPNRTYLFQKIRDSLIPPLSSSVPRHTLFLEDIRFRGVDRLAHHHLPESFYPRNFSFKEVVGGRDYVQLDLFSAVISMFASVTGDDKDDFISLIQQIEMTPNQRASTLRIGEYSISIDFLRYESSNRAFIKPFIHETFPFLALVGTSPPTGTGTLHESDGFKVGLNLGKIPTGTLERSFAFSKDIPDISIANNMDFIHPRWVYTINNIYRDLARTSKPSVSGVSITNKWTWRLNRTYGEKNIYFFNPEDEVHYLVFKHSLQVKKSQPVCTYNSRDGISGWCCGLCCSLVCGCSSLVPDDSVVCDATGNGFFFNVIPIIREVSV